MIRIVWACLAVATCTTGASAQSEDVRSYAALWDFMGGHGCTLGQESLAQAEKDGFFKHEVQEIFDAAVLQGYAAVQGDYIVAADSICTIRLPDIHSRFTVEDPFIRSMTSTFDHYDTLYKDEPLYEGEERFGCFLLDPSLTFDERAGGTRGDGFDDYITFLAASLISGDVRFYSPSPLRTPYSSQVMTGPGCDSVPNAAAAAASHPFLVSGFGTYIRRLGEGTSCDDSSAFIAPGMIAAEVQGADLSQDAPEDPNINAWLYFEWDLITMAAGWHEGMSGTTRGQPRPPLCHYPD